MLYAVTNNSITSEANSIFSSDKKQWKPNKIVFLMIYTFIFLTENVFPKYALIFQTLQKFGNFCHFRKLFFNFFVYVVRMDSSILLALQRIRTTIYTSIYFAEKCLPKFASRFQILPKFGHFFIIIFRNFL